MANNKNTVTTIPLASKLNMNKNQNQVCVSYDQMNSQNSPLYGGCIAPLHVKQQYSGNRSLIDKYGKRWFYSGSVLKRSDENNQNTIDVQDFSGNFVFDKQSLNVNAICGCITNRGDVLILQNNPVSRTITVRNVTQNYNIYNNGLSYPSNRVFRNARLVALSGNNTMLVMVFEDLNSINGSLFVTYRIFDDRGTGATVAYANWSGESLGIVASNGRWNYQANSRVTASDQKSSSMYTYPIIVSSTFWNNIGITILNRHMNGENVYDDFGYINFVASTVDSWLVPVHLTPNPAMKTLWGSNNGQMIATISGGKVVSENNGVWDQSAQAATLINDGSNSSQDWVTMRCPAGIWQDGNLAIVQINYNPNNKRGFIKGDENDYLNIYSMASVNGMSGTGLTTLCWSAQKGTLYPDIGDNVTFFYNNNHPDAWSIVCAGGVASNVIFSGGVKGLSAFFIDADESSQANLGEQRTIDNVTVTTNQYHTRVIVAGEGSSYGWGSGSSKIISNFTMLDSMDYTQSRSMPGIMSTTTIPTDQKGWQEIANNRFVSKDSFYCTSGSCTQIGNWRILFNYKEGFLSGISWNNGNSDIEGTLVTPWDEVDDGFVVAAKNRTLLYKDVTGTLNVITAKPVSEVDLTDYTEIIDNRYMLIHCDSTQNVFDLVNEKWGKFASDWNNRVLQGFNKCFVNGNLSYGRWIRNNMNTNNFVSYFFSSATWASGFNVAYQATKAFSPSRLLPYVTGNHVICMEPYSVGNLRQIKSGLYGKVEKCALDYFQSKGTSSPQWKGAFNGLNNTEDSTSLQGTAYPITSTGSLYNNLPITGTQFVNSYNGKFSVQVDGKGYSTIYDGVRPVMLYNASSIVDDIKEFFIIQSQTYAVVDSYICAISYSSSNVINGIEQLVDVNGMTFIGSFPSVAYFFSPSSRCIYAFTGDADLQLFVQTDRISKIYSHLYAPNNEWIYISTDDGLYVFTQQNVFRIPWPELDIDNYQSVRMYMTDDAWNVIEYKKGQDYIGMKIRLDRSDFTTKKVILETEFFGQGDMKQEICDTWYIRLYKGEEDDNGEILVYVKTLTDIVSKTDVKKFKITPDMWDDNNNAFIRYQPKYQMTQGSSLHIESDYPIANLAVSHQQDNTSVGHLNI